MFKKYFLYIINEIYLLNMSLFFIHYCNVAMLRDNKSVNCYFDRLLPRKYDSITTCPSKRHQKVCGGEVCRWRSWWWGGGGGGGGEWVSEWVWVSVSEWVRVSESEWEWEVRVRVRVLLPLQELHLKEMLVPLARCGSTHGVAPGIV